MRNEISCDVLIVGGGIGGLTCAVELKENSPETDVLVIEKQFAGYSGKANRGGGVLQYFEYDKIKPEEFAVFHANAIGAFLGDQELMVQYVSMNHEMLDKLAGWGVNVPKNEDGTYNVMPTGPFTSMICVDLDITLKVRRKAESLGVKFIDKTALAELFAKDGKICGAAAFSILDGTFSLIHAKRVVLATGSQNYRVGSMWSSGRGDGIAAAYRVGAEMRNAEFGNFAQLVKVNSHNEIVFGENYMYNAKGEFITRNFRAFRETDINSNAIREWFTQMRDGNGPVHLDFGEEAGDGGAMERMWNRPYGKKFRTLNDETGNAVDKDLEVCPMLIGEQSPIKVDHDMQTTIDGMYAVGDCSYAGSCLPGAVPAPPGRNRGSGILNAVFAGILCGRAIAARGTADDFGAIDACEVDKAEETLFAPMKRRAGVSPIDVIELVQKAMAPVELSVWMKEERMAKAEAYIRAAEALLPDLYAEDYHWLLSCREAEAMVLSAKMHYRVSRERKESRGWFLREDYPEMDNVNWLKWITVKNVDGEMVLGADDVPIDR
ncbi:MAG: FAD-binding protein, partial [Oscillospiraceae bacterium]|nr:FAD-binding protein [Oscillospiraceae bacterium]